MTATTKTEPATMPTHAATTLSLPPRSRTTTGAVVAGAVVAGAVVAGAVVAGVSMGPVADSGDDAVSLMVPILAAMVMRQ